MLVVQPFPLLQQLHEPVEALFLEDDVLVGSADVLVEKQLSAVLGTMDVSAGWRTGLGRIVPHYYREGENSNHSLLCFEFSYNQTVAQISING